LKHNLKELPKFKIGTDLYYNGSKYSVWGFKIDKYRRYKYYLVPNNDFKKQIIVAERELEL